MYNVIILYTYLIGYEQNVFHSYLFKIACESYSSYTARYYDTVASCHVKYNL